MPRKRAAEADGAAFKKAVRKNISKTVKAY